jgi:hypothetical protein
MGWLWLLDLAGKFATPFAAALAIIRLNRILSRPESARAKARDD